MILAGDIGGTRARLALFSPDAKRLVRQETYESHAYPNLESVLRAFLGARPPKIKAACFGIAGPILNQRVTATNFPWVVDARVIARKFAIKRVLLINDLVALGLGALRAPRSKLRSLSGGTLPKKKGASVAVIAAGTGLGEAAFIWDGERFVAMPTESGHADFGPRNSLQGELRSYLEGRFGRVTVERVLSGPGLGHLYDFFVESRGMQETPAIAQRMGETEDRNALVTELGLSGESKAAASAVDLFVEIYGAEAGNLALRTIAVGGVFVAGGIATHLTKKLQSPLFLDAFRDKEPMTALVEKTPVAMVLDPDIGLHGAAYHALYPTG